MVQIIETSAVKALMADMLPWDREEVLDEFRPYEDQDDDRDKFEDIDAFDAVWHFGSAELLGEMDLDDFVDYFTNNPEEWKELQEIMAE